MFDTTNLDKITEAVKLGREFATAVDRTHYNNFCDTEYYMFADQRAEGFDAVMYVQEGDKWGCEDAWYALKGTPEEIAATFLSYKDREVSKGVEYYAVKSLVDLNAPVEPQFSFGDANTNKFMGQTEIAETLFSVVERAAENRDAFPNRCTVEKQFSSSTMREEIDRAKPLVLAPQ